jgi:hypothetical protein
MEQQDSTMQTPVASIQAAEQKKPWHAPQLTAVSIAGLTEFMGNPGSDGTTSTPSAS